MKLVKLERSAATCVPYVLSLLRIVAGLLLLQHPLSKFFSFPVATRFPELFSLIWFAGVIEIVFGLLVLLGLYTRFAAFILAGELAFAYFIAHAPRGFYPQGNGGEAAVLFCFVFVYLACAGGGAFSVDRMRRRR